MSDENKLNKSEQKQKIYWWFLVSFIFTAVVLVLSQSDWGVVSYKVVDVAFLPVFITPLYGPWSAEHTGAIASISALLILLTVVIIGIQFLPIVSQTVKGRLLLFLSIVNLWLPFVHWPILEQTRYWQSYPEYFYPLHALPWILAYFFSLLVAFLVDYYCKIGLPGKVFLSLLACGGILPLWIYRDGLLHGSSEAGGGVAAAIILSILIVLFYIWATIKLIVQFLHRRKEYVDAV